MRFRFVVLSVLVLVMAVSVQAQSALQEMVKTEQAFSKMAEEKDIRDASYRGSRISQRGPQRRRLNTEPVDRRQCDSYKI